MMHRYDTPSRSAPPVAGASVNDAIWLTPLLIAGWGLLEIGSAYGLAHNAASAPLIYSALLGGYVAVLPMMLIVSGAAEHRCCERNRVARHIRTIAVIAIVWALYWALIGLAIGQHPKDVIGSSLRVALPFLAAIILIDAVCGQSPHGQRRSLVHLASVLVGLSIIGALGKLSLLAEGSRYGGGLNQYSIDILVMVVLALVVIGGARAPLPRLLLALLLVCLIGLSLLSLKRAVWINLAFALGLVVLLIPSGRRATMISLLAVGTALIAAIGLRFGLSDSVLARFAYTFADYGASGRFDASTTQRIAEAVAAARTLNQSPLGLAWLTGLGPGAGYGGLAGHQFYNLNERGEPYHLHSFVAITLFRYGLVGLVLHMALVGMAARSFWVCRRALAINRGRADDWMVAAIGAGASIAILAKLPDMITGNAYFGSFAFGLHVAIMVSALSLIHHTAPDALPNGRDGR